MDILVLYQVGQRNMPKRIQLILLEQVLNIMRICFFCKREKEKSLMRWISSYMVYLCFHCVFLFKLQFDRWPSKVEIDDSIKELKSLESYI